MILNYAGSKYEALEMKKHSAKTLPTDEQIQRAEQIIKHAFGSDI